jgi:hypothetical protein
MNTKRLILSIVAIFIGVFATDYIIHEVWLKADYQASVSLWRTPPDMQKHFPYLLAGQLIASAMFVLIWANAAVVSLPRACAFALCMGLAKQSGTFIAFFSQPLPSTIAVKWVVAGIVQALLMGVILFFTYKPNPVAAPKS